MLDETYIDDGDNNPLVQRLDIHGAPIFDHDYQHKNKMRMIRRKLLKEFG